MTSIEHMHVYKVLQQRKFIHHKTLQRQDHILSTLDVRPLQYDSLFPIAEVELRQAGGRFIIHYL